MVLQAEEPVRLLTYLSFCSHPDDRGGWLESLPDGARTLCRALKLTLWTPWFRAS